MVRTVTFMSLLVLSIVRKNTPQTLIYLLSFFFLDSTSRFSFFSPYVTTDLTEITTHESLPESLLHWGGGRLSISFSSSSLSSRPVSLVSPWLESSKFPFPSRYTALVSLVPSLPIPTSFSLTVFFWGQCVVEYLVSFPEPKQHSCSPTGNSQNSSTHYIRLITKIF